MRNTTKTLMLSAALAGAVILPSATTASAASDLQRPACGSYKSSGDRKCLMAVRGRQVNGWQVMVNLHVRTKNGHDWAWAAGWVNPGGHVWLERQHAGRTQTLGKITSPSYAGASMGVNGAVYDGPGYKARACADLKGGKLPACTDWF